MSNDFTRAILLIAMSTQLGCGEEPATGSGMVRFEFIHTSRNESMIAETEDEATISKVRAELQKPMGERALHISGVIAKGTAANNPQWSWHFVPGLWSMAEISMEVCDAWPSYVEENLDTWIAEVGGFCPWASRASKEL